MFNIYLVALQPSKPRAQGMTSSPRCQGLAYRKIQLESMRGKKYLLN